MRDHEGKLIRGKALWYHHAANSFVMMEALAIRDGVRLVGSMGLRNIIVETNAMEISKLGNSSNFERSKIVAVLQEIKSFRGILCHLFYLMLVFVQCKLAQIEGVASG